MTAAELIEAEFQRRKEEEAEKRAERKRRHEESIASALRWIEVRGKRSLGAVFPDEKWSILDTAPHFTASAYGQCQPGMVITDEAETFYLALTTNCSGLHWWWADPVATASGPCYWTIKDAQGEGNPRVKQIADWIEEKRGLVVRGDITRHFRERERAAKLLA